MQKIDPFLWFDKEGEEAAKFYTSIFPNSKIINTSPGPDGKVMIVVFNLEGLEFMALNAGPMFKINPSISFSVNCKTTEEVDELWKKLSDGGSVLMKLDKYPFSEKYGWLNDKYGVSWQISVGEGEKKIIPSLMFVGKVAGNASEAIDLYTQIFKNSKVIMKMPYEKGDGDEKGLKFSLFTLEGQEFIAMDSSLPHDFNFNEAVSLYVKCKTQEEVDELWEKLTADGGEESQCGWLKDKFGVSWQIIPDRLGELMSDPDQEKAGRAMQAMLKMQKIVIKDLEAAYNQS